MYRKITLALCLPLLGLITGCGTTAETEQASPAAPPPSPVSEPAAPPPGREFASRTDTVAIVHEVAGTPDSTVAAARRLRWVVQVGAFKDPLLANAAQDAARKRYSLMVLNDYNPLVGLYQIRVGFFASKEEAQAFREKLQKEFPEEYKGAWVVQYVE